jgi:hypothetical protein
MAPFILPDTLKNQIERFGINVNHPTDLYACETIDSGASCRVIFHIVGKLLSGPSVYRQNPSIGRVLHYKELRAHPNFVALAVLPCRETRCFTPKLEDELAGDLLQIDLRLFVPLHTASVHEVGNEA